MRIRKSLSVRKIKSAMVVKMIKIRGNFTLFRLYSSSLSVGFNRYELQERIKKSGIQLHFPQDDVQVKTRSLALIVGWAESRQKPLSKFAAIYTKQGIPCLSMACPITTIWFTSLGKFKQAHKQPTDASCSALPNMS